MGLFSSKEFNSLEELLVEQLQDIYDAEHRLTKALPKMAEAASTDQLKLAFQDHLKETETQIQRLESVFKQLQKEPERETCDAMKGLISEGEEMIDATGDPKVKDAALIAAAQRVEHYEIAAYGTARTFAQQLGLGHVVDLLEDSLAEEKEADEKLTDVAKLAVNPQAANA